MGKKKKMNEILAISFVMVCLVVLMEGKSITTLCCICMWAYTLIFVQTQKEDL